MVGHLPQLFTQVESLFLFDLLSFDNIKCKPVISILVLASASLPIPKDEGMGVYWTLLRMSLRNSRFHYIGPITPEESTSTY